MVELNANYLIVKFKLINIILHYIKVKYNGFKYEDIKKDKNLIKIKKIKLKTTSIKINQRIFKINKKQRQIIKKIININKKK